MSSNLLEIFRAKKPANRQEKRARRAMRFEMLEKRILPSANVFIPPIHAVAAPANPNTTLSYQVQSGGQAQQTAQNPATLAFQGAAATTAAPSAIVASSTQSQSTSGPKIVFVDPSVANSSQLVQNLVQTAEQTGQSVTTINLSQQNASQIAAGDQSLVVVTLNPLKNGVDQITQTLAQFQNVGSVDIISHGAAGLITVGTTQLSNEDLTQMAPEISQWKASLAPNASIVLYGCDVAGSAQGTQFVQRLSALTGANVAAATQDVGSAAEGGSWTLGYSTGPIAASALLGSNVTTGYTYLLADIVASSPNMNLTGTSGNDRFIFNNGWGSDTVTETGMATGTGNALDFSAVTANLTFTIHSNGTVSVTDGTDTLSATANMQELIGGSGNNTFVFQNGASFNGKIVGGGGTNTLDYSAFTAGVTVNLATGAATGTLGVSGISKVVFTQNGSENTASDAGGVLDFSAVSAALNVTVNTDGTVSATDGSIILTTGAGASKIIGGSGNNTFVFQNGATLNGTIVGGVGGTNTLDYSAYMASVNVDLTSGTATGTLGVSDIAGVVAGSGSSTVTFMENGSKEAVTDTAGKADFSFLSANLNMTVNTDGSVTTTDGTTTITVGASTSQITGGTGNNTVVFDDGASFAGTINGGVGGTNTLDYSACTTGATVDLAGGTATGTQGVSGFTNVVVSSGNDNIVFTENGQKGTATDSSGVLDFSKVTGALTMTVNADGSITTTDGIITLTVNADADVTNLIGGKGVNSVKFEDGASLSGSVDGGSGGTNTLDFSAYTTGVAVNLAIGTATGTGGISDFNKVIGGLGDNVLTAGSRGDTLIGGTGNNVFYQGTGSDTLEGNGTDRFVLNPLSSSSATITESKVMGGTLDYSLFTPTSSPSYTAGNPLTVNLATGSAPNVASGSVLTNISAVIGGAVPNAITGAVNQTFGIPDQWGTTTTISENPQSTNDALDFSASTGPLAITLGSSGSATTNNAISVTEGPIGTPTGQLALANGNGVGTIVGGSGDDYYTFNNDWGSYTINESSLPKTDTLDFSAVTQNLIFVISATGSVSVTSSGGSTLNISGSIGNIIGGKGTNTFRFLDQGALNGYITGGPGANILDYSAYTTAVYLGLGDMDVESTINSGATTNTGVGSATGVLGINGITAVIGGTTSTANTLTGYDVEDGASLANTTNTWDIIGQNAGTLTGTYAPTNAITSDAVYSYSAGSPFTHTVTFQNFEYLSGTPDSDSAFTLAAGGSVSGSISGRPSGPYAGTASLTIASVSENAAKTTISGTSSGTIQLDSNVVNFSGIDSILDQSTAAARSYSYDANNTATLTFAGTTVQGDTWTVGVVQSTNPTVVTNYSVTVAAGSLEDVLDQLAAKMQKGGLEANVSGDTMLVSGWTATTGAKAPSPVTFTGPSDNSVTCVVSLPDASNPQFAVFNLAKDTNNSGNLLLSSSNGSFSPISFAPASSSLTINGGPGNDIFQVDQSALQYLNGTFTINGGSGNDQIICTADTGNGVTSQIISCTPLATTGSGSIDLDVDGITYAIHYTSIASPDNVSVNEVSLNKTLTLAYSASDAALSGAAAYTVSEGTDTITMDTGIQSLAILGAGHEIIDVAPSITGPFTAALSLDGGAGSTVNLQGSATFTTLSTSADEAVNLGTSSVDNYVYSGVSGDVSTITVTASSSTLTIQDGTPWTDPFTSVVVPASTTTVSETGLLGLTIDTSNSLSGSTITLNGVGNLDANLTLNAREPEHQHDQFDQHYD